MEIDNDRPPVVAIACSVRPNPSPVADTFARQPRAHVNRITCPRAIELRPDDPADTEEFTYSYRLMWDIQVVGDAEDDVRTVARGWLWVYRDITVSEPA